MATRTLFPIPLLFFALRRRVFLTSGLYALTFCLALCWTLCPSFSLASAASLEGRGEVRGAVSAAPLAGNPYDVEGKRVEINSGYNGMTVMAGDASLVPDASARRNTLILNGGSPAGLYGGNADKGEVVENKVIMNSGTVDQIYGGFSQSGIVRGNTVEVHGGTVGGFNTGFIWGGYSDNSALAEENTVIITGGKVWHRIYGAQIENMFGSAMVQNNHVEIRGGDAGPQATGGRVGSGAAHGNSVSLSGTGVVEIIVGGDAGGTAKGNFVEISGGTANTAIGGSSSALAEGNYVTMSGGTVKYAISGAEGNEAIGNWVTISGGTVGTVGGVGAKVAGGWGTAKAQGNTVKVTGGEVLVAIQGGYSTAGDALENAVSIEGAATKVEQVIGGQSDTASATDNAVYIKGGEVRGPVIGGNGTIAASGNYVEMGGGTVRNEIYAGRSINGTVSGNSAKLSGGTVRSVWGGYAEGGDARGNAVLLDGATSTGNIVGGQSTRGTAADNVVQVKSGTAVDMYGGYGGMAATDNSVEMTGGTVENIFGGWSDGVRNPSWTGGVAAGNTVSVTGGTVTNLLWGGMGRSEIRDNHVIVGGTATVSEVAGGAAVGGVKAVVRNNSVTMQGGTAVAVYGGFGEEEVSGNTVTMSGGTVTDSVVGGSSIWDGVASGNSVHISGGKVGGAAGSYVAGGAVDAGSAINNTVTLSGAPGNMPDLGGAAIYGGYDMNGTAVDVFTGNTLNVLEFQGKARTVANFAQYNFFLPAHIANGSVVMQLSEATDISAPPGQSIRARITGMVDGGAKLRGGDVIHLLQSDISFAATGMDLTGGNFSQGLTRSYDYELRLTADSLDAVILGAEAPPEVEAPTDGPNADGGLINGGGDLIAGQGMDNALAAARTALRPERSLEQANPWGVGVFGVFTGGQTRYNTPSRLSLASTHYAVGVTKLFDLGHSEVLMGAYLDAGFGSYMTQRKAEGRPAGADGDSKYYGGGVLSRYALKKGPLAGAYVEGTARTGLVESSYRSEDLQARVGSEVKYDRRVPYYSAHGGLGYVYPITSHASVDIYGKFFWSRLEGSTQRIAGDEFAFLPLDSYRLRGGARVNYALGDNFSLYAGAAYEHEFDGTPRVRVDDSEIKGDSMRGGTGIGELGLSFTLGEEGNFSMDIGAQGFIGKREGAMGTVRAQWAF